MDDGESRRETRQASRMMGEDFMGEKKYPLLEGVEGSRRVDKLDQMSPPSITFVCQKKKKGKQDTLAGYMPCPQGEGNAPTQQDCLGG